MKLRTYVLNQLRFDLFGRIAEILDFFLNIWSCCSRKWRRLTTVRNQNHKTGCKSNINLPAVFCTHVSLASRQQNASQSSFRFSTPAFSTDLVNSTLRLSIRRRRGVQSGFRHLLCLRCLVSSFPSAVIMQGNGPPGGRLPCFVRSVSSLNLCFSVRKPSV